MSYAAISNYGDVTEQSLKIFRQELQESAVLRDWWQHGDVPRAAPRSEILSRRLRNSSNSWETKLLYPVRCEGQDAEAACRCGNPEAGTEKISSGNDNATWRGVEAGRFTF